MAALKRQPVSYIIWWAVMVHLAWGAALVADPAILPVAILVGLHWLVAFGIPGPTLGLILIAAALLAAGSLVAGHRLSNAVALLLLAPQYALLVAAFISDTQSVITSNVDGREIDRLVLFTVLWPVMIAALLHSLAIIERHLTWTRT